MALTCFLEDVSIDEILLFNKVFSSGQSYKYFIGYKNHYETRPLFLIFQKMRGCAKTFSGDRCMSSLNEDNKLLEKYNKIWEKFSKSIKREVESKFYSDKELFNAYTVLTHLINQAFYMLRILKHSFLSYMVDYFCKMLHLRCLTGFRIHSTISFLKATQFLMNY